MRKLARQLRREALASPKKAAVLGLLFLVALYYWGPLLWAWVSPGEESTGPNAAVVAADLNPRPLADVASAEPKGPSPNKTPSHPWTQLDEWIRQDPTTAPVEDLAGWRDPFVAASLGVEEDEDEQAQPDQPQATPQALGVELSGTLVGPGRRVALIGGKAYREGQTVTIDGGDRPIEFELVEVHSRRIVLGREGKQFPLTIPERKGSGFVGPSGHWD